VAEGDVEASSKVNCDCWDGSIVVSACSESSVENGISIGNQRITGSAETDSLERSGLPECPSRGLPSGARREGG
jgi:hypothetical protein